eukprot:scaffold310463_cov21-Tisochrysis_lutea.AAC.1
MVALDSNERATTRPITEQRETHARRTNSCTQLQSFFGSGTKLSTRSFPVDVSVLGWPSLMRRERPL